MAISADPAPAARACRACAIPTTDLTPGTPWSSLPIPALLLFILISMGSFVDRFLLGVILLAVKHDLSLTDEQAGRCWGIFTIANVAGILLFGYLGNKWQRKPFMLAGLLVWGVASASSGFALSLGTFLLWRAIAGFGGSAFQTLSPTWLADLFGPRWRNLVFSIYNSTGYVATAVAYVIGGSIAATYGWKYAFLAVGIPGFLLAGLLLLLREPVRGHADGLNRESRHASLRESLVIFRLPAYVIHLAAMGSFSFGMSGLLWAPTFFHRAHGISMEEAAALVGTSFLYAGIPGIWLGGLLASFGLRKIPSGYTYLLMISALGAALSFYQAFQAIDVEHARLFMRTGIFFAGLSSGSTTTVLIESVPIVYRVIAVAFGLLVGAGFGSVLSTEVIGLISDHDTLKDGLALVPLTFFTASLAWSYQAWHQWQQRRKAAGAVLPTVTGDQLLAETAD